MTNEDDRLRSIRFPQRLWDAIDADAERCKRSSVKQLEAVLSLYYGLEDSGFINMDRMRAMFTASSQADKGTDNGIAGAIAPRSATQVPLADHKGSRRRKTG